MSLQMCITLLICLISLLVRGDGSTPPYSPDWTSLDSRPLPKWYDEAKIGILIHWGVYSVLADGTSESIWERKGQNFPYKKYVDNFTATYFDPKSWAELFRSSGARYVVFTAKHHDGFTNWPSAQALNWNSNDLGPKRDLVGDLVSAVRNKSMRFGVAYSQYEWFNPIYQSDSDSGFKTQEFVNKKVIPQLKDLVNRYKPELIWANGDWLAPDTYWKSKDFLAWLYNDSPVKGEVVTNDWWGKGCACKHGGFFSCGLKYMPDKFLSHKWEKCQSIDKNSWGYRKGMNANEVMDIPSIIKDLVSVVAMGGNYLLNIGPMANGTIHPLFEDRLRGLGGWLKINGEAIYGSTPRTVQNEECNGDVKCTIWYTSKNYIVYAIIVGSRPTKLVLTNPKRTKDTKVTLLGTGSAQLDDRSNDMIIHLELSESPGNAWCLKLEGTA